MVRILAISGSIRSGSSNTNLLRAAVRLAPPEMVVAVYDGIGALPHFNPDLEAALDSREDADATLDGVRDLRAHIAAADAVVVSSPEYAHGVPGTLKNALDWLVGGLEFQEKPFALWNASPHSVFAQASLRETLRTLSGREIDGGSITVGLRGKPADVDSIVADPEIAAALTQALVAIKNFKMNPS